MNKQKVALFLSKMVCKWMTTVKADVAKLRKNWAFLLGDLDQTCRLFAGQGFYKRSDRGSMLFPAAHVLSTGA